MGVGISVAMASYNGRKYIREQLESIMRQSIKVDQLVIIDDASPEKSEDIIRSCIEGHDCELVYRVHEENRGYAQTFLEALSLTTGEYVFLADQDDIWEEDKVKISIQTMRENPSILCLSSCNTLIDGEGKEIRQEKTKGAKLQKISAEELILQKKLRPGMSLVLRDTVVRRLAALDTSDYRQHDRLVEYLAVMEDGFYLLNEYLNRYRIHGENTSGLNLSHFTPRTGREGRLQQIDKELDYLKLIRPYDPRYEALIDKSSRFFAVRRSLLERKKVIPFVFKSLSVLYGYRGIRVWLGDMRSIIKG